MSDDMELLAAALESLNDAARGWSEDNPYDRAYAVAVPALARVRERVAALTGDLDMERYAAAEYRGGAQVLHDQLEALRAEKGEAEALLGECGAGGTPAGLVPAIHNLQGMREKAERRVENFRLRLWDDVVGDLTDGGATGAGFVEADIPDDILLDYVTDLSAESR